MKKTTITLSLVLAGGVLYGCTPAPVEESYNDTKVVSPKATEAKSSLKAYSEAAVPTDAPYVLFFHADWCPTCVAWEKSVNAAELPENAMVFKVNFDDAEALKEQYGVKKQSTAVMIGADGEVVATASDPAMDAVAAFFTENAVVEEATEEEASEEAGEESTDEVVAVEEAAEEVVEVAAAYVDYSADMVPAEGKYILFFHAGWCPTCVKWEEKALAAELPENAKILKVNFDEASELAAQYGVKKQSTAVMINNGEVVATASDPSMDDVAAFFSAE